MKLSDWFLKFCTILAQNMLKRSTPFQVNAAIRIRMYFLIACCALVTLSITIFCNHIWGIALATIALSPSAMHHILWWMHTSVAVIISMPRLNLSVLGAPLLRLPLCGPKLKSLVFQVKKQHLGCNTGMELAWRFGKSRSSAALYR